MKTATPAHRALSTAAALAFLASTAARGQETPPPPAPQRPVTIPRPAEKTLPNGLRVVVAERHDVPLVSAELLVKTGGEVDPPALPGLADFTASLLTRGTKTRTAPRIAEEIEALGGTLSSEGGWDASSVSLAVLSKELAPAMEVLADVTRNPAFKDEEIERLRQERLDDLRLALEQPSTVASIVAARVVFGDGPYGHAVSGTLGSVARLKRTDIVKMHAAHYRPDNAVLVMGGDVKPEAAFRLAERLFGGWKRPPGPLPSVRALDAPAAGTPRVVVVDKPGAGQAAVSVAALGIRRTDPDYFRSLVANSVLTGYSGRLNQEVRIKRGLSYGAGSVLDVRKGRGIFRAFAQTKNESGAEVASLLLSELSRLADGELPESELTPRKAVLIGGFARALETGGGLSSELASLALYGLSFGELEKYVGNVQGVSADEVKKFAASALPAARAHLVLVGDASKFLPALKDKFPKTEVIPAAAFE